MKDFVLGILRTKTVGHSAITFTGTFLTGFLGAVFYISLARFLGPRDFGIFSVSVLFLSLLADIFNIGINTGIIRFVGKYISLNRQKALGYMKLGIITKILVSLGAFVVAWFIIPLISGIFFQKLEFIVPLRIALIGFVGYMIFAGVTASFDAMQKYLTSNSLSVGANVLRLFIILGLVGLGILTLNNSLLVYGLAPLVGSILGIILLPRFWRVPIGKELLGDFFNYNKWIAIFTAIAALSSRLDSFISARLLSLEDVGIYSVAVTLSSVIPQVVLALGVVAAPKLASFDNDRHAFDYLKKLQLFVLGLCVMGVLVGIPLAYFVIPNFYGTVYTQSFYPFIILLFTQAIFLFSVPAHTGVIYYFGYPKLFIYVSIFHLGIVGLLGWVLIGKFGVMGAAFTMLIGNIANFIIPTVWILRRFRKL